MKSVINILSNASSVTDLLQNGADSIFINREPQEDTPPYIVITDEIVDTNDTMTGENLDERLVSVYCVSDRMYTSQSIAGAYELSNVVRDTLVNEKGSYLGENYHITRMESESTFISDATNIKRVEVEQEYQVFSRRVEGSSSIVGTYTTAILLTQAQYDALGSYDASIYYLITDA